MPTSFSLLAQIPLSSTRTTDCTVDGSEMDVTLTGNRSSWFYCCHAAPI